MDSLTDTGTFAETRAESNELNIEEIGKSLEEFREKYREIVQEAFRKGGVLEDVQRMICLVEAGQPFSMLYSDDHESFILVSRGYIGGTIDQLIGLKPYENGETAVYVNIPGYYKKYPAWILRK